MSSDLGTLPRILKDGTRRRILGLLAEKGALSYVEILNLLEIDHTGRLNYHLKQLGDLVAKNQASQYILTLAVQVLSKFESIQPVNDLGLFRLTRTGIGKLFLVLVVPSFILSLIPLSNNFFQATSLSIFLGIMTVMLLIFGSVFVMRTRRDGNGSMSLLGAVKYGMFELALFFLPFLLLQLLVPPSSDPPPSIAVTLVYFMVLPGYTTWLLISSRLENHHVDQMLKGAIVGSAILWAGVLLFAAQGLVPPLHRSASVGNSASYSTNYAAVFIILVAELSLFVGQLASEGAYRLVSWKRRM